MLEILNLSKEYGREFSLQNVSMEINGGEWAVLFGSDDAGKTTLLSNILQMHHFRKGQIKYKKKMIQKLDGKERKTIRFVPDDVYMERISVFEYYKGLFRIYGKKNVNQMEELCKYFNIDKTEYFSDMTYEGNKLATIVGALLTEPELLILDEPFNFLTENGKKKLLDVLQQKHQEGMTILLTNDRYSDLHGYCDRFFYMKEGKISASGTRHPLVGNRKAVTIEDGNQELLKEKLGKLVAEKENKVTYLYDAGIAEELLTEILGKAGVTKFEVKNLTLEEILDEDYSRWM